MPTTNEQRQAIGMKMAQCVPEEISNELTIVIIMFDPHDGPRGEFTDIRNCSKAKAGMVCLDVAQCLAAELMNDTNPEQPFNPYHDPS